jgi:hypothetical protein
MKAVPLLVISAALLSPSQPGADLRPGMQLVYVANGEEQPAWRVEAVSFAVPGRDGSPCVELLLRRRPDQAVPDTTRLCVGGDTLQRWNSGRSAWVPERPLTPHRTLTQLRSNGDTVRFETFEAGTDRIGSREISVIETTVTTVDSLGRPRRRLRERYALSLATATEGRFEAPDSAGGWLQQQHFVLRAVVGD